GTTVTHLLARLEGRPVGLGTVVVVNVVAGLYDIAVLEDARGRGLGRAITAVLMRLGRERGGKVSVLHATPMGQPVYAKLGYKPMCEIPHYVWLPDNG
ncbi:MAG: GNAT family N-acetyltransferase, partial [Nocardioidaceae bacterium]